MSLIENILSNLHDLPTLPEVVSKLSKAIRSENTQASDIEKIITPDPAITTNLLRLANSAYFGFLKEITSVKQAVTLMGQKRVYELAVSGAFSNIIPPVIHGFKISSKDFWLHSIAVAVMSETLAEKLKINMPDMIFTAGLLHDVGKLAMGPFLEAEDSRLVEHIKNNPEASFIESEQAVFGTNHCEVGAVVAQMWNLPASVECAAKWHHDPNNAPMDADQYLIDLIHISDAMAHMVGYGHDVGGLNRCLLSEPLERCNLTPEIIKDTLIETSHEILMMGATFLPPSKIMKQKK